MGLDVLSDPAGSDSPTVDDIVTQDDIPNNRTVSFDDLEMTTSTDRSRTA
jgi:hypothetical protein